MGLAHAACGGGRQRQGAAVAAQRAEPSRRGAAAHEHRRGGLRLYNVLRVATLTVVVCLVAPLPTTVPEQVWLYGGTDSRSHRPCTALHALHLCELPSGWVTLTLILTLTLTLTLTRNPNPNP